MSRSWRVALIAIGVACSVDRNHGSSGGTGGGGGGGGGGGVSSGGTRAGGAGSGEAGESMGGAPAGGDVSTGGTAPTEGGQAGAPSVTGGAAGEAGAANGGEGGAATPACQAGASRCDKSVLSVCSKAGVWEATTENFKFNPDHCGACGHSCLGGTCSAGLCQPVDIATGESTPTGITVDGNYVYYAAARSGLIRRVDKAGAKLPETLANNRTGWPRDIVMAAGSLFFSEGPAVYRLVPDGSKLPEVWYDHVWSMNTAWELATDSGQTGVTAAQTTVAWWDADYVITGLAGSSTVQGSKIEQGGPGEPGDVAVDKSFFFWSRRGNGHNNGYVRAQARNGTTSVSVATIGHPVALAFDGSYLYWVSMGVDDETTTDTTDVKPSSGAIYRSLFVTGTQTWQAPQLLVNNIASPWDMVVDETWVYWTSYDGGVVGKVLKAGGNAIILAQNLTLPFNIAQDATAIYWTRSVHPSGGVTRLAK